MKFTEMKLHAMNAVKAYFKRNWKKEDMMNSQEIPLHAYKCLKKVYLTLFCALLSSTVGSFLHLIWEAGGFFTVLISAASILCLYFTPAMKVLRFQLLGRYNNRLWNFLVWSHVNKTKDRSLHRLPASFLRLYVPVACAVLALDLGYFVIYSQEILYNARYGDVNFVNCTFTVFFHLPAIVVHAARVYLVAESEHYRQN
uniref:Uncharacterized protein n=1 Tax=Nicotiana tabacum TaxID=4097 RepID=A0A1S4ANX2_TOBAC|nr:PREDICTED: uncharacterized protein LOC107799601 [Nicotiana tabacum]